MPTPHYERLEAIEDALSALYGVQQELQCYAYDLDNLKGWQTKWFRPDAPRAEPLDAAYRPSTQPYRQALGRHAQIKSARLRLLSKVQHFHSRSYNPQLVEDIQESVNYLHAQHCTGHPNEYLIDEYRAWLVLNDEYKANY